MRRVFKFVDNAVSRIQEIEKDCWVHYQNPTQNELAFLSERYRVPADFLNDVLDPDERARSEAEGRWLLIVLRIPVYEEEEEEIPYFTVPLGILVSRNMIITVCAKESPLMEDFMYNRIKNFNPSNKLRFVMQIFLRTALYYLKFLREINKMTSTAEGMLHRSLKNEKLISLLRIEKSLVFFATSLKSNELLIEKLQKSRFSRIDEEDADLLEDVLNETKQAIEMCNIYSNILSGMMDAFASIISNNLNMVMKLLTSITILLMIPTLIASIYGMNIQLPFSNSPLAFPIIMVLSVIMTGIGIVFFRRRDFF